MGRAITVLTYLLLTATVCLVIGLSACGGRDDAEQVAGVSTGATTPDIPPASTVPPATDACAPERPAPVAPPGASPEPPRPEPAPSLPASLVGAEWETLPTSRKVAALTFDCGANADGAPSILRTLAATETPATFFVTGGWANEYPLLARRIGARHSVGNHTFGHPDVTTLTTAAVRLEIRRAQRAIRASTGRDPRPLFRFPYGARDARTIALVNDLGYGSIRWTVDTLGWQGTSGGASVATVRARILAALRPGAIVLMHVGAAPDGSTLDADALESVIAAIRARGYRLVEVAEFVR